MKWLIENWTLLVVIACAVGVGFFYVKKFANLPSEEQMAKIKEWLLWAVIEAEKYYQGGTGQLKLRYVYDLFLERFPSVAPVISFEMFSMLVDEALEKMRHILETNLDIKAYVEGSDGE